MQKNLQFGPFRPSHRLSRFWDRADIWAVVDDLAGNAPIARQGTVFHAWLGSEGAALLDETCGDPLGRLVYCHSSDGKKPVGGDGSSYPVRVIGPECGDEGVPNDWFSLPGAEPLVLTVVRNGTFRGETRNLTVPLIAAGEMPSLLCLGQMSRPAPSPRRMSPGHWCTTLRIAADVCGPAVQGTVMTGLCAILARLTAAQAVRPVLVRLDMAGLGLSASEISRLEARLVSLLRAYGARSGQAGLLLGELGFVRDDADASAMLDPGRACRLDVMLPAGRHAPTFLDLRQTTFGRMQAPLRLNLRCPNGNEIEVQTGIGGQVDVLERIGGRVVAAVFADPARNRGGVPLSHSFGFGPTVAPGAQSQDAAETWEVTATNLGKSATRLTFFLEEALSLVPHWQAPLATVGLSRSHLWDPALIDSARPVFYDARSQLDALARRAGVVPGLALRRFVDTDGWPVASVCRGTKMQKLVAFREKPVTVPAARPQGDALWEGAPHRFECGLGLMARGDYLLDLCLEAVSSATPDAVEDKLDQLLSLATH